MLTPSQRRELKGRAHKLEPVVQIGNKGLTDEVMAEIERALKTHQLIKIRAAGLEREDRDLALTEICTRTRAEPVQQVGKVFVIFRKSEDKEEDE